MCESLWSHTCLFEEDFPHVGDYKQISLQRQCSSLRLLRFVCVSLITWPLTWDTVVKAAVASPLSIHPSLPPSSSSQLWSSAWSGSVQYMSGINADPMLSDALSPSRSPADPPSKTSFLTDLQSTASRQQPVSQKTSRSSLIGQLWFVSFSCRIWAADVLRLDLFCLRGLDVMHFGFGLIQLAWRNILILIMIYTIFAFSKCSRSCARFVSFVLLWG